MNDPDRYQLFTIPRLLDPDFDIEDYSDVIPGDPMIALDEYAFIQWNLERWHDRAFNHSDPWNGPKSAVVVWN